MYRAPCMGPIYGPIATAPFAAAPAAAATAALAAAPTAAGAIPSQQDVTAATAATAAVAPHTPYYPGYVASPPLHHPSVSYPPPPTGVPPPVAGSYKIVIRYLMS